MKHTLHVLGMPHAPTTSEHVGCAYTSKVLKFCKMMHRRGHNVIHYGVEGSNPLADTKFVTLKRDEYNTFFTNVRKEEYYPVQFSSDMPYWQLNNKRQNELLKEYAKPTDLICLIGGTAQLPAAEGLSQAVVEYGIGYYGVCPNTFKCYESYAHMHVCYGQSSRSPDGRFTDTVVPNYFDLDDFDYNGMPDDYLLFVGRLIDRKGIHLAIDVAKAAGKTLLVAGQGFCPKAPHVQYVGFADRDRRNTLMGNAEALICPTLYVEPFGGVNVEAQLTGTPVLTTDFGAFTETVKHGKTGYRCRTFEEFVNAAVQAKELDRKYISKRARERYSLEAVAPLYEDFFNRVYMMHNTKEGWYGHSS